jgi:hypothetical protein
MALLNQSLQLHKIYDIVEKKKVHFPLLHAEKLNYRK